IQRPVFVGEAHLSYSFAPRLWISADGNYWTGGGPTANGGERVPLSKKSRAGGTPSGPFTKTRVREKPFSGRVFGSPGRKFQTGHDRPAVWLGRSPMEMTSAVTFNARSGPAPASRDFPAISGSCRRQGCRCRQSKTARWRSSAEEQSGALASP